MHAFSKVVVACLAASALVLPLPVFAQSQINVNGAGATFPFPLIDTWRVEYKKVDPNFNLNYQSIGSGGGIKQFTEKTVDFGASDAPLNKAQHDALPGASVHIPETIGSVVAAYNIPGINQKGLKLTGPILADIYLGKITMWDDPAIKSLNPDLPLPSKDILVVRRSDGSGTTFVWTDFLSSVSPGWKDKVGKGTAVQWPVGRGAPGNEGVATTVKGASYSIGYVELAYALTTGMNYAFIQNQAGNFIEPTLESTQAAVAAFAGNLPKGADSWETVSMVNAAGDKSYPIASFSYILLYQEMSTSPKIDSQEKAKAIVDFLAWAISPAGQAFAQKLSYVPLPDAVVKLDQQTLASLTYKGQPAMQAPNTTAPGSLQAMTPASTSHAEQQPVKDYKTKLTVSASLKKSNNQLTIKLKNPATNNVSVHQFTVTLDGANALKAKASRGWTAQVDGDTVTFSTDQKPILKGKFASFRITANATVSSMDWEAFDADGNSIDSQTTTVRVR
jgi:phosphate transport system permease protein/phosphate transport system substrate-binding protein